MFLNNFGIIFIYHALVIVLYVFSYFASKLVMGNKTKEFEYQLEMQHLRDKGFQPINTDSNFVPPSNPFVKIKNFFHNEILVTSFLVFIVEEMVFIIYNFHHNDLNHGIFVTSLIFAIIYLAIIIICLIYVLFTPLMWDEY